MNRLSFGIVIALVVALLVLPLSAVAGTAPPMDLNAAVKDIQTKVTNLQLQVMGIAAGVANIQTTVNSISSQVASCLNKLTDLENELDDLNNQDVQKMALGQDSEHVTPEDGDVLYIATSGYAPFKVTLTIKLSGIDTGEDFQIIYLMGKEGGFGDNVITLTGTDNEKTYTYEFVADSVMLWGAHVTDNYDVYYSFTLEYSGEKPNIQYR